MNDFLQQTRETLETQGRILRRRLGKIDHHLRQLDGSLSADWQEQATELENDEVLNHLRDAGFEELQQIDAALQRMADNTYGYCVSCDGEIGFNRLKAVPYTPFCLSCAESIQAKSRR